MNASSSVAVIRVIALCILVACMLPLVSHAQGEDAANLSATIRAAILKDPRASNIPPAELDAMVAALTAQAQTQGVTAQEIAYRPGEPVPAEVLAYSSGGCTDISAPLCGLGKALGFDVQNKLVPIGLWLTSGILVAVVWHMRRNPHIAAFHGMPSSPSRPGGKA